MQTLFCTLCDRRKCRRKLILTRVLKLSLAGFSRFTLQEKGLFISHSHNELKLPRFLSDKAPKHPQEIPSFSCLRSYQSGGCNEWARTANFSGGKGIAGWSTTTNTEYSEQRDILLCPWIFEWHKRWLLRGFCTSYIHTHSRVKGGKTYENFWMVAFLGEKAARVAFYVCALPCLKHCSAENTQAFLTLKLRNLLRKNSYLETAETCLGLGLGSLNWVDCGFFNESVLCFYTK